MLYRLATVLGFTAFFMITSITNFIKYASSNMEQFAFIFGVDKASPILGTMLGLEYFFPLLFVILCLAAGCLATQLIITVLDLAAWAVGVILDAGIKLYRKFDKSEVHQLNK